MNNFKYIMKKSSSDTNLNDIMDGCGTGGTSGQQMDPMLAQLMAMMNEEQNKENQSSNLEEQKQGESNTSTSVPTESKR